MYIYISYIHIVYIYICQFQFPEKSPESALDLTHTAPVESFPASSDRRISSSLLGVPDSVGQFHPCNPTPEGEPSVRSWSQSLRSKNDFVHWTQFTQLTHRKITGKNL